MEKVSAHGWFVEKPDHSLINCSDLQEALTVARAVSAESSAEVGCLVRIGTTQDIAVRLAIFDRGQML